MMFLGGPGQFRVLILLRVTPVIPAILACVLIYLAYPPLLAALLPFLWLFVREYIRLSATGGFSRRLLLVTYLPRPGWPRFWALFGFCLPKKTRETVYEPGRNELLEDYQFTRRKYRTKWARRWLAFCFTFRTVLLIADCWRVLSLHGAMVFLLGFLPPSVRQWFTRQS